VASLAIAAHERVRAELIEAKTIVTGTLAADPGKYRPTMTGPNGY